jgi:ABC-type antimicrobial peptide transport system permease subunit
VKRHTAIVMGVILIPTHPLECVVSRTAHRVPVIQTVKQIVQLFRERYIDGCAVIDACVMDSSMYIEHIINPMQHRIKVTRTLKIESSVKLMRRTQCMKIGFNRGVRSVGSLIGKRSCQV